ncbi:hypothetical protein BH683_000720 [Williamsia sp. 1138]|nr:hypothetical protein BH683_000720 [Williamsia sp. 1138]
MYFLNFSEMGRPSENECVWWVSDENFERLFDDCLERGYLQGDVAWMKIAARGYKGLPDKADTLRLLRPFRQCALERIEEIMQQQPPLPTMDQHYLEGLQEGVTVFDRVIENRLDKI